VKFAHVVFLIGILSGYAHAFELDTVDWATDSTADGTGTGTLANGSITVTYSTIVGKGDAGTTIADDWNTSLATESAVGSGVTNQSAGVLGMSDGSPSAEIQTVSFSSAVTDPVLMVDYGEGDILFSSNAFEVPPFTPVNILDSNNATYSASDGAVFMFDDAGAFNDGFAATVEGTYGPSDPLSFGFTTVDPFASVAFTVGIPTSVPEPDVGLLAWPILIGAIIFAGARPARTAD
jgi:hypothetical protein